MIAPEQVDHVILPGSFNPFHEGHSRMAGTFLSQYPQFIRYPITLEISRVNRDKGAISYEDLSKRIESVRTFGCMAPILVTELPLFVDKARVFPNTLFLVGSDTASRILRAEVPILRTYGARFAVFNRAGHSGSVPYGLSAYWVDGWEPVDVSSSKIREEGNT